MTACGMKRSSGGDGGEGHRRMAQFFEPATKKRIMKAEDADGSHESAHDGQAGDEGKEEGSHEGQACNESKDEGSVLDWGMPEDYQEDHDCISVLYRVRMVVRDKRIRSQEDFLRREKEWTERIRRLFARHGEEVLIPLTKRIFEDETTAVSISHGQGHRGHLTTYFYGEHGVEEHEHQRQSKGSEAKDQRQPEGVEDKDRRQLDGVEDKDRRQLDGDKGEIKDRRQPEGVENKDRRQPEGVEDKDRRQLDGDKREIQNLRQPERVEDKYRRQLDGDEDKDRRQLDGDKGEIQDRRLPDHLRQRGQPKDRVGDTVGRPLLSACWQLLAPGRGGDKGA